MAHIFISYSRKNQTYARALAEDIRQHGFDVWIDDRIDYGDRWWRTIVAAIEACSAFVIVMSPTAEESEWVEREILLAQREKKPIFPLLLEGKELALLITTQFADVRDGSLPPDDFYERLRGVVEPAAATGTFVAPESPKPKPANDTIRAAYIAGGFALLAAIIAGLFGLWQGVFANPTEKPSAPARASSVGPA